MKKLLVTLLAASMCVSMLAGCGGDESSTTTDSNTSKTESSAAADDSTPSGNVELRDFTMLGDDTSTYIDYTKDLESFPAWQALRELEAAKGVNMIMETVQNDQYQTTLQTRFAAMNEVPMFACMYSLQDHEVLKLANQGVVISINDLLEAGDGTAKAFFDDGFGLEAKHKVTAEDGNMYWLPNIYISDWNGSNESGTNWTVGIRKDWLDKYNLEIPTTLDEYTNALKTFNENDPSGSGVAAGMNVYSYNPTQFNDAIGQWFGLVGGALVNIHWDDQKAISPWHQDTMKDYMSYLNSLCSQGLYDTEMLGSTDTFRQKVSNNQVGSASFYALATTYEPLIESAFPGALYADMEPIQAVEGVTPLLSLEDPVYIWDKFSFTKNLTDAELGGTFLDVYYSQEHIDIINYGVEGTQYEMVNGERQWKMYKSAKEGTDFKADMLNEFLEEKANQRLSFGKILYSRYLTPDMSYYDLYQSTQDCREAQPWAEQKAEYQDATINYGHWTSIDVNGSLATATDSEQQTLNDVYADTLAASEEAISQLVLGQRSVDEIDSIVADLDAQGLTDITAIYQARYDRFLGK